MSQFCVIRTRFTAISLAIFLCCGSHSVLLGDDDPNVIETFHVAKHGDFLLVPVTIDDAEYQFCVDTGSTCCVLDTAFREKLGSPSDTARIDGRPGQPLYDMPEATVGKSTLPVKGAAVCMDLASFRRHSGHNIRGFLGMTFLKHYVVRIDFDNGLLSILRSMPQPTVADIRMTYDDTRRPTVGAEIGDAKDVRFMIDTGLVSSASAYVDPATFAKLIAARELHPTAAVGREISVYGDSRSKVAWLDALQIADLKSERLRVRTGASNVLTLDYLSRFVATFDFANGRLRLEKGPSFEKQEEFNLGGFEVERVNGEIRIHTIRVKGPAEEAGFSVGDRLLQIGGKPADDLSIFEIRRILALEAPDLEVAVEREGTTRATKLRVTKARAEK